MHHSSHVGTDGNHKPRYSGPSVNSPTPKKKLLRRLHQDHSQFYRRVFQASFLALNLVLGTTFYFWVRQFESGSAAYSLDRPAGVEGWLPIAGLMNLKYWLATGHIPEVHPAAMFLLLSFLAMAFLLRKSFCSWLCPVGTVSEYLWLLGRKLFHRNFHLSRWIDLPLRSLKYLLLAFFAWAVYSMSPAGIRDFMASPYGLIADVKMLNFFRHIGETGLLVLGSFAIASLFIQNFWCRFLCPYGALLGLAAFFSPARIRRSPEPCIDCAKCAKACPANLPVDKLITIRSIECTGCVECVAACPAEGALAMSLPSLRGLKPARKEIPAWAMAAAIAFLFLGAVSVARLTSHWQSRISTTTYEHLVPQADSAAHPMP